MKVRNIIIEQTAGSPAAPFREVHFIDGAWCDIVDGVVFDRIVPADGVLKASGQVDDVVRQILGIRESNHAERNLRPVPGVAAAANRNNALGFDPKPTDRIRP